MLRSHLMSFRFFYAVVYSVNFLIFNTNRARTLTKMVEITTTLKSGLVAVEIRLITLYKNDCCETTT